MLKRLLNLFSPSIKVISKLSPLMSSSKKIDQNRIVTSLFAGSDEHAVAKMFLPFAGTVVFISHNATSQSVPLFSSNG